MKRCAYAYVPSFVRIDAYRGDLDHYARVLPCQPKMLRKWFYRTAKRVVGERHYGELRKEADALYPAVMGELKHLL